MLDTLKKGSTSRSVTLKIIDSTDGTPETGVLFNTTDIALWYRREDGAVVSITLADLTTPALTDTWETGGFLHISDGDYRLDVPDDAFPTGANFVDIGGTVPGMVVIGGRVKLVNYDPEDVVRLGLTALPANAANAAGGMFTRGSGAGQINQDANGRIDSNTIAYAGTATDAGVGGDGLPASISLVDRNAYLVESLRSGHTWQGEHFYLDPFNGDTHASGNRGGRTDPYNDLQDCHDNAIVSGRHDTIFLVAGDPTVVTTHTVASTTTLSKRYFSVRGPGRDFIITRTGSGDTIAVTGDGISLSGFQLGTAATGSGHGIKITDADFVKVEHVWILDTQGDGVHILRGSNCVIRENVFSGTGIGGTGQGVHIVGTAGASTNNVIKDNIFSETAGDSILIEQGTTNATLITKNLIHDSAGWAINIGASSTDAVVHGNVFGNNTSGNIMDGGTTTVEHHNDDWASAVDIALAQADLNIITGADGVTLATTQGNYAPNVVVPDEAGVVPTAVENREEMDSNSTPLSFIPAALMPTQAEVLSIQNNTRTTIGINTVAERPDSGSTELKIYLNNYDTEGNMEAPDSAPTVVVVNEAGTSRSGNLQHPTTHAPGTTMVNLSAGRYWIEYDLDNADALESLTFTFSIIEGGVTRIIDRVMLIVDTTAVDFTAADRTKLGQIFDDTNDMQPKFGTPAVDLAADIADVPTVAEFDARTIPTADYFDAANDAVANVTLTATTTTLTNKTGFSLAATGLNLILVTSTFTAALIKGVWDRIINGANHNISASAGKFLRDAATTGLYTGGQIWIDTSGGGSSGTDINENGTQDNPSDNIADATVIAIAKGKKRFNIAPGSSFTLIETYAKYIFLGDNGVTIAMGGQTLTGCVFRGLTTTGEAISATRMTFDNCHIGTSTEACILPPSHLHSCIIQNDITVNAVGTYLFTDCRSGIAGTDTFTFDFGAAVGNTELNLRAHSGGIKLENMGDTGTDVASIEGVGQVIEGTCAGGNVTIRGNISRSFTDTDNITWDEDARVTQSTINTQVDTAIVTYHLDQIFFADYNPASKPGVGTALFNELIGDDGGVSQFTTNALENAPSGSGGDATAANQTIIKNRLGAITGSGVNTVLGFFQAGLSKAAATPSDIGGTFLPATDSNEGTVDRGNVAWVTGAGGTGLTALGEGTAQGGAFNTIQIADASTFADNVLQFAVINILTGTGAGQSRSVVTNVEDTDTLTVSPAWEIVPDNTSTYELVQGIGSTIIVSATTTSPLTATPLTDSAVSGYYGTIDRSDTYFSTERLDPTNLWAEESDNNKIATMTQATRAMDRLQYIGERSVDGQPLEFPRGADTVVPLDIERACYEIAYALLDGRDPEFEAEIEEDVSDALGTIKSTKDKRVLNAAKLHGILSEQAWLYLRPYLRDGTDLTISRNS